MKTDEFYTFPARYEQLVATEDSSKFWRSASLPLLTLLLLIFAVCGLFWREISAASSTFSALEENFHLQSTEVAERRHSVFDLVISPFGNALFYRDHHGKVFRQDLVAEADRLGTAKDLFPGKSCENMKMSPVENTLVATFSTGELYLQNLDSADEPVVLLEQGQRIIESLAFSPDGSLLAAGMSNGSVIVWNIQSQETISVIRGKNTTAFSVLFDSPTSLLISFDNGLERWTFRESSGPQKRWRRKRDWRIEQSLAREMAVTSDGRFLLASSFNGMLTCWELPTQQRAWEMKLSLPCVRSLAISRDEASFVCHGDADTITVRDLKTGEPKIWLTDHNMGTGTGARFSLDGNLLYSASSDGLVRIWTIPGEALIGTIVTNLF